MDLMHWHGVPSELAQPPKCCADHMERRHNQLIGDALFTERRRIVRGALDAIDAYWSAASSVLDMESPGPKLAGAVVEQCRAAIQAAGCICPQHDVSTYGEAPGTRFLRGSDPRCGVHR